jgi:hypothetical protein
MRGQPNSGDPFYDDYDPEDPTTWYEQPLGPAPWDMPPANSQPDWMAAAMQYGPQALGGFASGFMQLPYLFNRPAPGGDAAPPASPPAPESGDPAEDLRKLRMYRARQSYERNFGRAGPFGSAESVTSEPDALLKRIQQARSQGWRPG